MDTASGPSHIRPSMHARRWTCIAPDPDVAAGPDISSIHAHVPDEEAGETDALLFPVPHEDEDPHSVVGLAISDARVS